MEHRDLVPAGGGRQFRLEDQLSRDERYDRADEFLDVACKLSDSWRDGALVLDADAAICRSRLVRPIDHHGKSFTVRGPLDVSRSPQGRPVFIQAGASDRGRDFAARSAEIIFVTHASVDSAKEFYRDMKARAAKAGRDPDQMKFLPGMRTDRRRNQDIMAEDKRKPSTSLRSRQAGLSTLSYHLDIDLSQFQQDRVLPTLDVPGVQGHYKEVSEMTQRRGLTLSQAGKQYGVGPLQEFCGTGADVADKLEEVVPRRRLRWLHAADALRSGRLRGFRAAVIPELQGATVPPRL